MSSLPRTPSSRMPGVSKPAPFSSPMNSAAPCAHARVQIVARAEDGEFVECLECREIFEASEFRDMAIEEKIENSEND